MEESGPTPWPDDDKLEKPTEAEEGSKESGVADKTHVDSSPQRWGLSRTLTESFKSMNEMGLGEIDLDEEIS